MDFSSATSGLTVWRRYLFWVDCTAFGAGVCESRSENLALGSSVVDFFGIVVPGVITPVDEDRPEDVAFASVRNGQLRRGRHLGHVGPCPVIVTLETVGSQTRRVASIAVPVRDLTLAELDMIDADAPHKTEGVTRDVDIRLIIGLNANQGQRSRFLLDQGLITEHDVIEPLHR